MDQKKLVDAFNEIVNVDNEVHFSTTQYDLDSYEEISKKSQYTNKSELSDRK